MASFDNHIKQAKSNLSLFKLVCDSSKHLDWQVTSCYYVAVHLVNAHIAKTANLHYKTHSEVKQAINPNNHITICALDEDIFDLYQSLEKLSRMARYLCDESGDNHDTHSFITKEKHVIKALTRLNKIIAYFISLYPELEFDIVHIRCPRIKAAIPSTLEYFKPLNLAETA